MDKRPHLLRRYDLYKGCHPQRLDHFNVFAAEVQGTVDFYARLGFRLTEYGEEDGPNGRIAAAWLHRKGNVHDLHHNGKGPRLHHFAYWVPTAMNILHLCDVMASSGFLRTSSEAPAAMAFRTRSSSTSGPRRSSPRTLHQRTIFGRSRSRAAALVAEGPAPANAVGRAGAALMVRAGLALHGQAVREPAFVAGRHDCGLGQRRTGRAS